MFQSLLLTVFLSLVAGMTFKEEKYGNSSTYGDLDRAKWTYGETLCIWIVLVAVLAELGMFFGNFVLMISQIFTMIKSGIQSKKPRDSSVIRKEDLKRYKNGVFFKVEPNHKKPGGGSVLEENSASLNLLRQDAGAQLRDYNMRDKSRSGRGKKL